MKGNPRIQLIPVIELVPSVLNTLKRSCSESLDIKPIRRLSWLFRIDSLPDEALSVYLEELIRHTAEDFDSVEEVLNDPIEYAPLFAGGYLFVVDDEIKSEPICCCGLENIIDWKNSETLTIGHEEDDFVYIQKKDHQVEISIKEEVFIVDEVAFKNMINATEVEVDHFINRSGDVLNSLFGILNGSSIARAMIYK